MTEVLHISASPKGEFSASEKMAEAFLAKYRAQNPTHGIRRLNVFEAGLPPFGKLHAIAKFAPIIGEERTAEQEKLWQEILAIIRDFDRADKILLSTPMWNYSIPWALKLYIDCIMQPRVTFGFNPETKLHMGLLKDRPVQFLLTRSSTMPGDYGDFQLPYLRWVFNSIGLHDIRVLSAWQTTKPTREAREAYVREHVEKAAELASGF